MNVAEEFFFENSGYSYDPKTQTPEEGQRETAEALAQAEVRAKQEDARFKWEEDSEAGFLDVPYNTWTCDMYVEKDGEYVHAQSLGGIDLGPDATPDGLDRPAYVRVVEAELAHQHYT